MSQALRIEDAFVSVEDYLSAESDSSTKHEYVAGVVYAMAGASRAHNVIAGNLLRHLGNQLAAKKWQVFGSDMRLHISQPTRSFYYYPDVTVDCSASKKDEVDEPSVIIEVPSPATVRTDQGEKLLNYSGITSMRVYVLIDQFQTALTVYRRSASGEWMRKNLSAPTDALELPEIGCTLPLAAIYERVFEG